MEIRCAATPISAFGLSPRFDCPCSADEERGIRQSAASVPLGRKWSIMAALATGDLEPTTIQHLEEPEVQAHELGSTALLDIIRACFHANSAAWILLRELRVGTGFRNGAAQRLDAFALNCFTHTLMKRVCYEIKMSRADFFCEMKQPLKRRIGLRYSNEFYFVTPGRTAEHFRNPH